MANLPYVTSFMLASVDGKISMANGLVPDFDRHIPMLPYASHGLHQYYEIESTTDAFSIISSSICDKLRDEFAGYTGTKIDCTCVVIDRNGVVASDVMLGLSRKFVRVIRYSRVYVGSKCSSMDGVINRYYVDLESILEDLHDNFGAERVTLQTGSTLNSEFMSLGLIDELDYVVAPIVCGGVCTPSLFGGDPFSLCTMGSVTGAKELCLKDVAVLEDSYIRLRYLVIKSGR